jgi:alkylhydroperoxidase/carboxymuconolactone decarboxylase family protein YurZ
VISDPLVSREHALLRISEGSVLVEDLGSVNGTYVNNVRISEAQSLKDGDHILVGTQELRISVVHSPVGPEPASSELKRHESTRPSAFDRTTERADALVLLGRVAARKLSDGSPKEAERALADHLLRVLMGARSGAAVSAATCAAASKHALLLAMALAGSQWVDYVLELHYYAALPMDEQTAGLLEEALSHTAAYDRELFIRYVTALRQRLPELDEQSRRVFARLAALELEL